MSSSYTRALVIHMSYSYKNKLGCEFIQKVFFTLKPYESFMQKMSWSYTSISYKKTNYIYTQKLSYSTV